MPNAPEPNAQQDSFAYPPEEGPAHCKKKQPRENKTRVKALEQRAIAIRADHTRKVMPHCAERSDKEINVLRTPARLGQRKDWHQQQRRADVENQVPPRIEYP